MIKTRVIGCESLEIFLTKIIKIHTHNSTLHKHRALFEDEDKGLPLLLSSKTSASQIFLQNYTAIKLCAKINSSTIQSLIWTHTYISRLLKYFKSLLPHIALGASLLGEMQ